MFFPSLQQRNRQPEIMDQPHLDERLHHAALRGLERINWFSGSARILWPSLAHFARLNGGKLSVLDVATGAGDLPIRLKRKAIRAGYDIGFTGCDMSSTAIEHARQSAHRAGIDVAFEQRDVLCEGIAPGFDVIICSLFLHHLDEPEALKLLTVMRQSGAQLVLLNDLERSKTGYLLACTATRLLSRSRIVHVDGPLSVRGAFSKAEARNACRASGLDRRRA